MQPWEANDIDKAFKQAAKNASFPYQPGDWSALNARLAAAQKKAILLKVIALGSLILLIGVGYYSINTDKTLSSDKQLTGQSNLIESKTSKTEEVSMDKNSLSEANILSSDESSSSPKPINELPDNVIKTFDNSSKASVDRTSNNDEVLNHPSGERTDQKAESVLPKPDSDGSKQIAQKQTIKSSDRNVPPTAQVVESILTSDNKRNNNLDQYNLFHAKNSELPGHSLKIATNELPLKQINENEGNEIIESKPRTSSRFSLGLSLAPEYSGISFEGSKPGFGLGITASYYLANRLSIATGVFYSKKVYDIGESGYGTYNGLWNQVRRPDDIDASCKVIEIPLNLRLDMISTNRSKIFIGTGLSTYFMTAEDYAFIYNSARSQDISGINLRGENNHFFSIYNFSIGFQRRLTDRFGIEIEPYIKVPIGGVGLWNVNLTSSGTFITARYFF